jgi:hypothetical protein
MGDSIARRHLRAIAATRRALRTGWKLHGELSERRLEYEREAAIHEQRCVEREGQHALRGQGVG